EHDPIRAGRNDRLLQQQLEAVGDRLQQTERTDNVRPLPHLHRGDHLPLSVGEIGDRQKEGNDDCDDVKDDLRRRPRVICPEISHGCRSSQPIAIARGCSAPWFPKPAKSGPSCRSCRSVTRTAPTTFVPPRRSCPIPRAPARRAPQKPDWLPPDVAASPAAYRTAEFSRAPRRVPGRSPNPPSPRPAGNSPGARAEPGPRC